MTIIRCRRYWISFPAYLEDDIGPDLSQILKRHLAVCPACLARLETLRKTLDLCHELPLLPVPDELHRKIMESLPVSVKLTSFTMHLIIRKSKMRRREKKKKSPSIPLP